MKIKEIKKWDRGTWGIISISVVIVSLLAVFTYQAWDVNVGDDLTVNFGTNDNSISSYAGLVGSILSFLSILFVLYQVRQQKRQIDQEKKEKADATREEQRDLLELISLLLERAMENILYQGNIIKNTRNQLIAKPSSVPTSNFIVNDHPKRLVHMATLEVYQAYREFAKNEESWTKVCTTYYDALDSYKFKYKEFYKYNTDYLSELQKKRYDIEEYRRIKIQGMMKNIINHAKITLEKEHQREFITEDLNPLLKLIHTCLNKNDKILKDAINKSEPVDLDKYLKEVIFSFLYECEELKSQVISLHNKDLDELASNMNQFIRLVSNFQKTREGYDKYLNDCYRLHFSEGCERITQLQDMKAMIDRVIKK